jgi:DNA-binding transcriptional LysR family regulator
MSLRQMHYFAVLAQELHFGRTAARLHIAQPALSQQIRNLEEQIGVRLLERTSRKVCLTKAGKVYYERVQAILADIAAAEEGARQIALGQCGVVEAGYLTTAMHTFLPDAVKTFRQAHPNINLRLQNLCSHEQYLALDSGELDVAFANLTGLHNEAFMYSVFIDGVQVLAVPEGHRLASRKSVSVLELNGEAMVSYHRHSQCKTMQNFFKTFETRGVHPVIAQEAPLEQSILALVAGGIGVAMVPDSCALWHKEGIVYLPFDDLEHKFRIAMVWRDEQPSPALGKFLDTMLANNPCKATPSPARNGQNQPKANSFSSSASTST